MSKHDKSLKPIKIILLKIDIALTRDEKAESWYRDENFVFFSFF